MAAGLEQYDWMVSYKERPWHGIGTVVDGVLTSDEAIKMAKLDWDVMQTPAGMVVNGKFVEIPSKMVNYRSDNNIPLGIVSPSYKIEQNKDCFKFVDDIVNANTGNECHYETAGSLFNGKRIFLCVRMPDMKLLGDDVENYLFFTNSHDGSKAVTAGISSIRVVCNNTLQFALKNAKRTWNCKHNSTLESRKKEAMESLGMASNYLKGVEKEAEEFASTKLTFDKFRTNYKDALLKYGISEGSIDKLTHRVEIVYNEKNDLANFKGTKWGIYNAVADYASNYKPIRITDKSQDTKMASFLDGNYMTDYAYKVLQAA